MKKHGFSWMAMVLFTMAGCASAPSDEPGILEGAWAREDGAAFTFTGRKYELVDMENGVAAYGTFNYTGNRITFTNDYILNLRESTTAESKKLEANDFLRGALAAYHEAHPDELAALKERLASRGFATGTVTYYGEWRQDYSIEGNSLVLAERLPRGGPAWYTGSYQGGFTRQPTTSP